MGHMGPIGLMGLNNEIRLWRDNRFFSNFAENKILKKWRILK